MQALIVGDVLQGSVPRLKHVQLRLSPDEYERLSAGKDDGESWEDYIMRLAENED